MAFLMDVHLIFTRYRLPQVGYTNRHGKRSTKICRIASRVQIMNKKYTTTMEDAADGSGDGILTFPPELLADMGWKEGDSLDISINKFGVVIIKKLDNV